MSGEGTAEIGIIAETGALAGNLGAYGICEILLRQRKPLVDDILLDGESGGFLESAVDIGAVVVKVFRNVRVRDRIPKMILDIPHRFGDEGRHDIFSLLPGLV